MGVLDSLINVVKGVPQDHVSWKDQNSPLNKILGLAQNVLSSPQRMGQVYAQTGGGLVPGLVDAAAGPFSPMVGDAARRILPKGVEQRLNVAGVATNPQQSRQMVGNMGKGILNTIESAIKRPQDIPGNLANYAYENPMAAAMTIGSIMANPAVSAAKVKMVNSMQSGSADLGANVMGGAVPNEEDKIIAGQGWQPGVKQSFDTALSTGDANTVRKLLPTVPQYYQQQFAEQINNALQGKGMLPGPTDSGLAGQNFVNQGGEPQTQFNGFSQSGPQNQALNIYKAMHPDASQAALDRFNSLHPGGVYQQGRTLPATYNPGGPVLDPVLADKADALELVRTLKNGGFIGASNNLKNYLVSQVSNSLKK